MIVSINQPAYLPWLGYFQRIAVSDLHIVLDHVQFEKNSFTNRNKIRTANGWTWLTVPVKTSGAFGHLEINTLEVDDKANWRKKHWATIAQSYAKAPYFAEHAPFFEAFFQTSSTKLVDVCNSATTYLLKAFGISTSIQYSSQLNPSGTKDELVLNLCQTVGATTYLSGALGRNYLREPLFQAQNIQVLYQNYQHPTYSQIHGAFEPYMTAIDLLFNCGPRSLDIIMRDQTL